MDPVKPPSNLIAPEDAAELIGREGVSFVDASWYLPSQNRDGYAEFLSMRIPGAVYFDINKIADPDTDLPHMLPSPRDFARDVGGLGIRPDNLIVVYDGPGIFSAARVWWTFRIMGAENVVVLEGGFDRWKEAGFPVETGNPNPPHVRVFEPKFDAARVASQSDLMENLKSAHATVLDARSTARFKGEAEEPRPGLRSGHIPGSKSLPFDQLLENGTLKDASLLDKTFTELGISQDTQVVTSCGSGVTAAVLTLALAETGRENTRLYDGSWAQWGMPDGPPVDTK